MTSVVKNRPFNRLDSQNFVIYDSVDDLAFLGDYLAGTNLIYKGFARPGSATANPVWQIAKLAYDGNNNVISIKWPLTSQNVASNDYEFIWDNRASLTYV